MGIVPSSCAKVRAVSHAQDERPNSEVLQICNISGIEALLIAAQFHWTGYMIRMSNDRLPKIIFYSELKNGARSRGGQRKRYKDTLKANLKRCSIVPANLETLGMERSKWRSLCKTSIRQFESDRIRALEAKREQRKTATIRSAALPMSNLWTNMCFENWAVLPLSNASTLTTIRDPSCRRTSPNQPVSTTD